jgi:hypothetical protein
VGISHPANLSDAIGSLEIYPSMPFAIDFNPPIITVSVQGFAREPSISIKVDLGTAGLPQEVSDALEFSHPHLLPWAWKRAFFAVLGDRYGAGIKVGNGMEGVVAIDTRPFLDLLVDIATQRIEFRLVAAESLHGERLDVNVGRFRHSLLLMIFCDSPQTRSERAS